MEKLATEANYQERFFRWVRKMDAKNGKCPICDAPYRGWHQYHTHLRTQHPEKYQEWLEWVGVRETK